MHIYQVVSFSLLIIFASLSLAESWGIAQDIDPNSPFLKQRYKNSIRESPPVLMTIAEVFRFTGNTEQGRLLHNIVERQALKQMLYETYTPTGTIEAAIRAEAAEPETIEAIRMRTLSKITLGRIKSIGDELAKFDESYSEDAAYIGNSMWTARQRDGSLRVHLRLSAQNSITLPLQDLGFILEQKDSIPKYNLALSCKPEDGDSIESKNSKTVMCWGWGRESEVEPAVELLKNKGLKGPFTATSIRTIDPEISVNPHSVHFNGEVIYADDARRLIAAASCNELGNCAAVAQKEQVQHAEKWRSQRPRLVYLSLFALTVLSLFILVPRIAEFSVPASKNLLISLLVGAAVLTTAAEILGALVIFIPNIGYGGMLVAFVMFYVGKLHLILVLALGIVLGLNSQHVTRFRVFVCLLGIFAVIAPFVAINSY